MLQTAPCSWPTFSIHFYLSSDWLEVRRTIIPRWILITIKSSLPWFNSLLPSLLVFTSSIYYFLVLQPGEYAYDPQTIEESQLVDYCIVLLLLLFLVAPLPFPNDYIEERIQTYQEQLYFVTFLLGESKEKYQLYVPVDIKVSALQYLVYLFSTFSFIVAYRKPQECQVEQWAVKYGYDDISLYSWE